MTVTKSGVRKAFHYKAIRPDEYFGYAGKVTGTWQWDRATLNGNDSPWSCPVPKPPIVEKG